MTYYENAGYGQELNAEHADNTGNAVNNDDTVSSLLAALSAHPALSVFSSSNKGSLLSVFSAFPVFSAFRVVP